MSSEETYQITSHRGGVIHKTVEGSGTPNCNPWQDSRKFKRTNAEATCKRRECQ